MANDSVTQASAEKRYGIAKEATFGTAIADDGAFVQLQCEHAEVDRNIKTTEVAAAHGSRIKRDSNLIVHYKRAMPTITLTGFANHSSIDHFLYGTMQAVTEGESTPYSKTFVFSTTQPDFLSNAGWFGTIIERDPAASKSTKLVDAICKELTLSIKPGEPLRYSAVMLGRGLASVTSNPSGTWTEEDEADIWWFEDIDRVTMDLGGGDVNFNLAEAEFKFGFADVEAIGQDGSGSFQNYGLHTRVMEAKIVVIKDADWHTALSQFSGNTAISGNIGWGNATPGTDDGDFDIAFRGKIKSAAKVHDEIMKGELTLDLLDDDTATTKALTIVMANATDRTW